MPDKKRPRWRIVCKSKKELKEGEKARFMEIAACWEGDDGKPPYGYLNSDVVFVRVRIDGQEFDLTNERAHVNIYITAPEHDEYHQPDAEPVDRRPTPPRDNIPF